MNDTSFKPLSILQISNIKEYNNDIDKIEIITKILVNYQTIKNNLPVIDKKWIELKQSDKHKFKSLLNIYKNNIISIKNSLDTKINYNKNIFYDEQINLINNYLNDNQNYFLTNNIIDKDHNELKINTDIDNRKQNIIELNTKYQDKVIIKEEPKICNNCIKNNNNITNKLINKLAYNNIEVLYTLYNKLDIKNRDKIINNDKKFKSEISFKLHDLILLFKERVINVELLHKNVVISEFTKLENIISKIIN